MTGLPFVFAVWVANKILPQDFLVEFNAALDLGINNIKLSLLEDGFYYSKYQHCEDYLTNKISYNIDIKKKQSMRLFLNKLELR